MTTYEYKYIVCVLDEKRSSFRELEKLVQEGWEPLRETAMPSSGSQYSEDAQLPVCLCVLRRPSEATTNGE